MFDANATSVLFVCMGNVCRSPTAEGVTRQRAQARGMDREVFVESAGTGAWHVGEAPDRRAVSHAAKRGYDLSALRARQVCEADFSRFHYIFAMDRQNLKALQAMRPPAYAGHLGLFLEMVPSLELREVPDPYFGGAAGFEHVLDLIEAASEGLLERLRQVKR